MRAVNLLPVDRRSASRTSAGLDAGRRNLLIACGGVGLLIVVGLTFMVWSSSSSLSAKQNKLEDLQSQIAATSSAASVPVAAGTRKASVVGLLSKRLAWDDFLGTISKVMPEDVWLASLQSTTAGAAVTLASAQASAASAAAATTPTPSSSGSTTSTPPPAPQPSASTFTINGYTYSQPSVARMIRRLDLVPWLAGVSLVSSSKTTIGSDTVFQFSVKASVVPPETAP
ncbi:MAG TPA: PilN domain-containing protein [Gaiellaceae bacterium]|jgi:Tfp pilus assembly protein PilN|nr:PilN domain-containing protein [Gaiellaceae bacterium]